MSDDQDRDQKTEEASQRRIDDALAKGNVPFSREASGIALLLLFGFALPLAAPHVTVHLAQRLVPFLDRPVAFALESPSDAVALAWLVGSGMALSLWPVFLCLALAGILSSVAQNRPRVVLQRIKPDLSRISLVKGFARIFGAAGQIEFVKSILKITAVAAVAWLVLRRAPGHIASLPMMDHDELIGVLVAEVASVFASAGLLLGVLAAIDVFWTRQKWRKDLRMSRQEVKEEHKQAEGDPFVRLRQRSLARSRARERMMAAIPRATLVVANPTHYAVALRYVQGETAAPVVVAKGVDHIALRIREIAALNAIPVIEDRALARSLHAAVQTDRQIPQEFYRAIAEIILLLLARQGAKSRRL